MEDYDYIQEEINLSKKVLTVEEVINFTLEHDVQIIRGEDWQYQCYIDKKVYFVALTTIGALVLGIKTYLDNK